jgi:hypothetical protein
MNGARIEQPVILRSESVNFRHSAHAFPVEHAHGPFLDILSTFGSPLSRY